MHSYITITERFRKEKSPCLITNNLVITSNIFLCVIYYKHISDRYRNFLTLLFRRNDFSNSVLVWLNQCYKDSPRFQENKCDQDLDLDLDSTFVL